MHAAVITGQGSIELREVPEPVPVQSVALLSVTTTV